VTHWEEITIQDLVLAGEAEVKTGPFGTQLHASDYVDEGIPVINVRNIGFGDIKTQNLEYISEHTAARLASHLLQNNDIVFGRKGAVERHVFIKKAHVRWFQGSDCLRLRINSRRVNPRFVSYRLLCEDHKQWMMNQCSHGATMSSLNQDIVKRILLKLPPFLVQHKIVSILSAYDDLIKNNNHRIKILEEMTQTIYREWFVHFRFPGHEKVKMVDSPMGKIPEGWEVKSFTDIADVLSGGTPKTNVPEYWSGEIPFFAPVDAPNYFYVTKTEKFITQAGLHKCSSSLYEKDTVFITARGTVGKVIMAGKSMAMNQSCYALVGKEGVSQPFLFFHTLNSVNQLRKSTGGATFETIIIDTFRRLNVLSPSNRLIDRFSHMIKPSLDLMLNLTLNNELLRRTRDLLLPKLISGEVDVSELDITVPEEAA
jgi:type I restriction enzyme S subunit